ncbi:hypothetical protein ALT785_390176 [Alteromonas infernus]
MSLSGIWERLPVMEANMPLWGGAVIEGPIE